VTSTSPPPRRRARGAGRPAAASRALYDGGMSGDSATYVFALIRRARAPAVTGAPSGPPGLGLVRTLAAGPGMWLIVADAPRAAYDQQAIERGLRDMAWVSPRALGHEAVVEHFGSVGPLLPLKLFTIFASDERAQAHIRARRAALSRALDKVAGRHEWGVRLSGEGKAPAPARVSGARSGTQFLLAKKAQRDQAGRRAEQAGAEAEGLFTALSRHADGARRRPLVAPPSGGRLWLDAAFLVARGRRRSFQAALRRESRRLEGLGFQVTLTGPWPPYNFVENVS
jgi:hypothetical protein